MRMQRVQHAWRGGGVAIAILLSLACVLLDVSAHGASNDRQRTHWSYQPLVAPGVPQVENATWVRNPIDAFILAELESANMQPSPEADRRTLIRRVSFNLTGLPPTPEDVKAFVDDPAPDAYEKLIDRLLASPR